MLWEQNREATTRMVAGCGDRGVEGKHLTGLCEAHWMDEQPGVLKQVVPAES